MKYATTPLLKHYVGEHIPDNPSSWVYRFNKRGVIYLSEEERKPLRVSFIDGIAYDVDGKVFSTHHESGNQAKYVMDGNGVFYVALKHIAGYFQHSSFLAGGPVAAAGEFEIDPQGILKMLSDRSNQYKPAVRFTQQAVDELISCGVDMKQVTFVFRPG